MDIYTGSVPRKFIRLLLAPAERPRTESAPTTLVQEGSGHTALGSTATEEQSTSAPASSQTSATSNEPTGSESSTSLEDYASAMASKLSSQGASDTSISEDRSSPVVPKESTSFVRIAVGPLAPIEREPEFPQLLKTDLDDTIVNIDSDDAFLKDPVPPSSSSAKVTKRKSLHSIATDEGVGAIYSKRPSSMVSLEPVVQNVPWLKLLTCWIVRLKWKPT